ncbi:isopentenyl-diphosphate Delta-isomerase [Vaginella massiliensis]|uniref:isopentenyl-diphosphate Delta-isomerase n=1 Tax=Vaginella massiliensis TaxID=1816680 RepID=UPI000837BB0E|nr:isopentenyl-diphosphate Delta-isomerase [Vaginella massiliensis]
MEEFVVLVNPNDEVLGLMEKQQAHVAGLLHRAFSVFIFNDKGELLLQQRAADKYHSPSLWTNTCCSHPRENETYLEAANRRLLEEMGFETSLEYKFHFIYKANFENGLTEHELDHVFVGTFNGEPKPNSEEVMAYRWISIPDLISEMEQNPTIFTAWFKIIFDQYLAQLQENY